MNFQLARLVAGSSTDRSEIHTRKPYNKWLGVHCVESAESRRTHVSETTGGADADWVAHYGGRLSLLPLDCIRGLEGTGSNFIDWSTDRFSIDKARLFNRGNILDFIQLMITNRGIEDGLPLDSFANFIDLAPEAKIFIVMNVYTQSNAEVIAGIDKFKALVGSRPVHWEMGNEISGDMYTSVAAAAFSSATGDDLATITSWWPRGAFNPSMFEYALRLREIAAHIRGHYPEDKIGAVSEIWLQWYRPSTGPEYYAADAARNRASAKIIADTLPDLDGVVIHYHQNPSHYWTTLAGYTIPETPMLTDSATAEKLYRWLCAQSLYAPAKMMEEQNRRWDGVDQWLTEWGCECTPDNPNAAEGLTHQPVEIQGTNGNLWMLGLIMLSDTISWAEQINAQEKINPIIALAWHHGSMTTKPYNATNFLASGALSACGIAMMLLAKASAGATHFAPMQVADQGLTFKGVGQYDFVDVSPVRGLYFDDGTTQKLLLINLSPNARTVKHWFSTSNKWVINDDTSPFTVFPDSTYYDIDDLTTGAEATDTYTAPPFSITLLENTGAFTLPGDYLLLVT